MGDHSQHCAGLGFAVAGGGFAGGALFFLLRQFVQGKIVVRVAQQMLVGSRSRICCAPAFSAQSGL